MFAFYSLLHDHLNHLKGLLAAYLAFLKKKEMIELHKKKLDYTVIHTFGASDRTKGPYKILLSSITGFPPRNSSESLRMSSLSSLAVVMTADSVSMTREMESIFEQAYLYTVWLLVLSTINIKIEI